MSLLNSVPLLPGPQRAVMGINSQYTHEISFFSFCPHLILSGAQIQSGANLDETPHRPCPGTHTGEGLRAVLKPYPSDSDPNFANYMMLDNFLTLSLPQHLHL
jgi:hypothetical protein